MVFLLEWVSERRLNVTPHEVLHHKYRATRRHRPQVRHNRDGGPAATAPLALARHVRKDHH
jgi:hypothetical protein